LEDQKRDVAPRSSKDKTVNRKPSRASYLTIMIVANLGKVRSFRISSRFLTWSFLFFVFYIVVSIIIINDYFEKRWTNNALTEQLEGLQYEIEGTKKELYRSKQHLALLESHIYPQETDIEEEVKPPADTEVQEENTELSTGDSFSEIITEDSRKTLVDIQDLEIKRDKNKLTVFFNLVNMHEGDESANGYVHIIAMNKESDPPQLWTYPKVALRNGLPIDYKRGQLFLIKRFKTIRGEYFFSTSTELPSSIKVLVYDQSGKILLQKEFEVETTS
jgi:cell division protein FtsB